MFSKNIKATTGRGLLLFVDKQLDASEIKSPSHFEEILTVRIKLNKKDTLLVALVYRSESGSTENNEQLNSLFESLSGIRHTHLLIMGYFNYPHINWTNLSTPGSTSREALFLEAVMSSYLTQHVKSPTRF